LDRVWRLHLEPAGFTRFEHVSSAVLSVSGPGTAEQDRGPLFRALRGAPMPRSKRGGSPPVSDASPIIPSARMERLADGCCPDARIAPN
jgi:hypothetical protein